MGHSHSFCAKKTEEGEIMKKLLLVLLVIVFVLSVTQAIAEEAKKPAANPAITKIETRLTELQVQAKNLTDKRKQYQNGIDQIDRNLLMLQGAFDELTTQRTELVKPEKKK
jgi:peptidoglycan hydrolase CwlO-like protein